MKLVTLKKRRDFVLSNKHGQKTHNKNFILQEYCNPNIADKVLMFGFTATKRIGNAVKRNRAKRRAREAIRTCSLINTLNQVKFVIILKKTVLKVPFIDLKQDIEKFLSHEK